MPDIWLLALLILVAATLYSSVGHAGASGYLAAMAIVGLAPESMKPTALVLNILVACIASIRYRLAGFFSFRVLWPFLLGSIPFAFLGGAISLPGKWYKVIVGVILILAAVRLVLSATQAPKQKSSDPPILPAVLLGALIGFLAGLTGTGGGIFLSPLLLLMGWAETRESSGVAATFILVNSISGLAGAARSLDRLPSGVYLWACAAILGGLIGSELGTKRLGVPSLRMLLGAVLVVAGFKLILT
jgi:uncharacterized membrane protein YfcA